MAKKPLVRSQMPTGTPSMSPPGAIMNHNVCPQFSKPKDMGNGGIPEKFHEGFGEKEAARVISGTGPNRAPGLQAPSAQGPTRAYAKQPPPTNKK